MDISILKNKFNLLDEVKIKVSLPTKKIALVKGKIVGITVRSFDINAEENDDFIESLTLDDSSKLTVTYDILCELPQAGKVVVMNTKESEVYPDEVAVETFYNPGSSSHNFIVH